MKIDIIPTKKQFGYYLLWLVVLLLINFLSNHSHIDLFSNSGTDSKTESVTIWPFTNIIEAEIDTRYTGQESHTTYFGDPTLFVFHGLFYGFNSESLYFWLFFPLVVFILIKTINPSVSLKPNLKEKIIMSSLLLLNLALLILSFSPHFNFGRQSYKSQEFWPFVDLHYGILYFFDFTEFAVLSFVIFLIYFLKKLFQKVINK